MCLGSQKSDSLFNFLTEQLNFVQAVLLVGGERGICSVVIFVQAFDDWSGDLFLVLKPVVLLTALHFMHFIIVKPTCFYNKIMVVMKYIMELTGYHKLRFFKILTFGSQTVQVFSTALSSIYHF